MPYLPLNQSKVEQLPSRVRTIVIGGGIHGVGVAHDLASRDWRDTLLLDKGAIGEATSSASTKLIHGGLRYLKRISQFSMVFKSLEERKILLKLVPDLVRPVEFLYPVLKKGGMPSFMIRIGLFLYDLLAGRKALGKHRALSSKDVESLAPGLNQHRFKSFFSFWDAQTDDLSLVIRVASSAAKLGATIAEGIEVVGITQNSDGWLVRTRDAAGETKEISCLYIVNCSGPWMNQLLEDCGLKPKVEGINNRGSHIVIRDINLSCGVFLESPNHLKYISSEGVLNPQPKRIVFDSTIDFAVFPNPTRDFFDLHFTNPNEITRVLIKNNQGIILKEFSIGFEKFKTDSNFAPVVYYITVMTPRNQKTKTIIKL